MQTSQQPVEQVGSAEVPKRPLEFDRLVADLPKYFANGDIVMSHALAVQSAVFPDGEDYFVASVEAVRDRITDPVLARDVEGFIGQEAMHGREHRVLNERLAELGYPTRAIGRYVKGMLGVRRRIQSDTLNVAFTAALEHYTATLAETLLTDAAAREAVGHPAVRDLLTWHALEESEHKAVAFDVFQAIGGTDRMRRFAMWLTHMAFVLETGLWTVVSLARDPEVRADPGRVARSAWGLRRSPFVSPRALRQLAEYHRKGFHPNDRDTTGLIAEWREELFGADGRLTDLVAS